jgi:hypothetical protein|tara:strand:- start:1407 stop:1841 length:435 start_codon:yes stop_codon:yes gene_type:complete
MAESINAAIIERLEKVVNTLQENSMKMGQLLAVHDEKLNTQDQIDAVLFEKVESLHREVTRKTDEIKTGCERDIRKVDDRLRAMEKKMWSIFGALSIISFVVSPVGQKLFKNVLTTDRNAGTISMTSLSADAILRPAVRKSPVS